MYVYIILNIKLFTFEIIDEKHIGKTENDIVRYFKKMKTVINYLLYWNVHIDVIIIVKYTNEKNIEIILVCEYITVFYYLDFQLMTIL